MCSFRVVFLKAKRLITSATNLDEFESAVGPKLNRSVLVRFSFEPGRRGSWESAAGLSLGGQLCSNVGKIHYESSSIPLVCDQDMELYLLCY